MHSVKLVDDSKIDFLSEIWSSILTFFNNSFLASLFSSTISKLQWIVTHTIGTIITQCVDRDYNNNNNNNNN